MEEDDLDDEDFDEDEDFEDDQPHQSQARTKVPPRPLISLLEELGDVSLVSRWIGSVLAKDVSVDPGKTLGDLCEQQGWTRFRTEILEAFSNPPNSAVERNARLLADFSLRKDKQADRKALCTELAERIISSVERWEHNKPERAWRNDVINPRRLFPPLFQAFLALDAAEPLDRLVTYILDRPQEFDLTTVQVPLLLHLGPWLKRNVKRSSPALQRWLAAVLQELEHRASHPPQEPADWRRTSDTGCKCADCKALSGFLNDASKSTLRLPLVKERRQHLHQVIDRKKLDTTHVTERRGRPYTLVLTKTKGSYERALQAHHVDLDHLAKVRKLRDWHDKLETDAAPPKSPRKPRTKRGRPSTAGPFG